MYLLRVFFDLSRWSMENFREIGWINPELVDTDANLKKMMGGILINSFILMLIMREGVMHHDFITI